MAAGEALREIEKETGHGKRGGRGVGGAGQTETEDALFADGPDDLPVDPDIAHGFARHGAEVSLLPLAWLRACARVSVCLGVCVSVCLGVCVSVCSVI